MTVSAAPTFTPAELAAVILADEPDTVDAPLGTDAWTTTVGALLAASKLFGAAPYIGKTVAYACRLVLGGSPPATITGSGGTGIIRFSRPTRFAKCSCGKTVPTELVRKQGMFEDLGPTSRNATDTCVCGRSRSVHEDAELRQKPHVARALERCGGVFQPLGAMPFDSFYCGCYD